MINKLVIEWTEEPPALRAVHVQGKAERFKQDWQIIGVEIVFHEEELTWPQIALYKADREHGLKLIHNHMWDCYELRGFAVELESIGGFRRLGEYAKLPDDGYLQCNWSALLAGEYFVKLSTSHHIAPIHSSPR